MTRKHDHSLQGREGGFTERLLLLSRITELAELVTLRVPVSTVITSELAGYTGSVSCVVVVHGEVELGVDLEQARFEDVDVEARTATLVLPQPTAHSARLDYNRTKIYSMDRHGLWWLVVSDEPVRRVVNLGMQKAQSAIDTAGRGDVLLNETRERAERQLGAGLEGLGWKLVLRWHV